MWWRGDNGAADVPAGFVQGVIAPELPPNEEVAVAATMHRWDRVIVALDQTTLGLSGIIVPASILNTTKNAQGHSSSSLTLSLTTIGTRSSATSMVCEPGDVCRVMR